MKKLLAVFFIFGFFIVSVSHVNASVLSDALVKIDNLTNEIIKLKASLTAAGYGYSTSTIGGNDDTSSSVYSYSPSVYGIYNTATTTTTVSSAPTLSPLTATSITKTSAVLGANITSTGNPSTISSRIIFYGTYPHPTNNSSYIFTPTSTTGPYTVTVSSLACNTLYYYYGSATNATGTGYSIDGTFRTLACNSISSSIPTLSSLKAQNVTTNSAILSATITSMDTPVSAERGVCYLQIRPGMVQNISDGAVCVRANSSQTMISATNLIPGTSYKFRAFATTTAGTGYSEEGTFTTLVDSTSTSLPIVTLAGSVSDTTTSAQLSGSIASLGLPASVSERGICYSLNTSSSELTKEKSLCVPAISGLYGYSTKTGVFGVNVYNLLPGSVYKFRAYAQNTSGIGYSEYGTFTTLGSSTDYGCLNGEIYNSKTSQLCPMYINSKITVLSPKVGDTYNAGQTISITWTKETPGLSYMTFYKSDSAYVATVRVINNPDNSGYMMYNLPSDMPAGQYKIHAFYEKNINGSSSSLKLFESNGYFTINSSSVNSSAPTLTINKAQNITTNSAILSATIADIGNSTITEKGICYGTVLSSSPSKNKGDNCYASQSAQTMISATNLITGTTYKFRGYATNASGTGYSEEGTFKTLGTGTSTPRTLRLTNPRMTGDDVKLIQQLLELTADGIYGRGTAYAVSGWQAEHGITADGTVGPETRAKMGL